MKLPRTSVVWLLVALPVATLILCQGYTLWRRSSAFYGIALKHKSKRSNYAVMLTMLRSGEDELIRNGVQPHSPLTDVLRRRVRYEDFLYRKYRQAARFPWRRIDPQDPPEPPAPQ